jgi:ABC-type nitrate/sulfonate/bicarbonate transport system permease component
LKVLGGTIADGTPLAALGTTLRRAIVGYGWALSVGLTIGLAVSGVRVLRLAVGCTARITA